MAEVPRRPRLTGGVDALTLLRWMVAPPRWMVWTLAYATVLLMAVLVALNVYVVLIISASPNRVTKDVLCVSIEINPPKVGQQALRELHLPPDYCRSVHLTR